LLLLPLRNKGFEVSISRSKKNYRRVLECILLFPTTGPRISFFFLVHPGMVIDTHVVITPRKIFTPRLTFFAVIKSAELSFISTAKQQEVRRIESVRSQSPVRCPYRCHAEEDSNGSLIGIVINLGSERPNAGMTRR